MDENEVSRVVYECAIEVHRELGGPGLLESVYEEALVWELRQRGLKVERQREVPIPYKSILLATPLRLDVLVEDKVIVECKAVEKNIPLFGAQVLTYLRLSKLKLGMIVNFGEELVARGIHRVVNKL
jgi:GxxExxY protein